MHSSTKKYVIDTWKVVTSESPFQLDGITSEGEHVFVREQYGHVRVDVNGVTVFQAFDIPEFWGMDDLKRITSEFIEWNDPI
jgi:hypothetical protein